MTKKWDKYKEKECQIIDDYNKAYWTLSKMLFDLNNAIKAGDITFEFIGDRYDSDYNWHYRRFKLSNGWTIDEVSLAGKPYEIDKIETENTSTRAWGMRYHMEFPNDGSFPDKTKMIDHAEDEDDKDDEDDCHGYECDCDECYEKYFEPSPDLY